MNINFQISLSKTAKRAILLAAGGTLLAAAAYVRFGPVAENARVGELVRNGRTVTAHRVAMWDTGSFYVPQTTADYRYHVEGLNFEIRQTAKWPTFPREMTVVYPASDPAQGRLGLISAEAARAAEMKAALYSWLAAGLALVGLVVAAAAEVHYRRPEPDAPRVAVFEPAATFPLAAALAGFGR